MATLIKNQILKHLSKFAKNLNPEHLNISAFRGEGELHHLELNEEILAELLELPSWLLIKRAFCNRVTARIPWASLKSVPIKLRLYDLELVIETTEDLRPLSKVHVPSYSSGGSYGFVDKTIDGMSVSVENVIVTFRSQAFFASIELSQVYLYSTTPQFKLAELKCTRLKDTTKGETLIFKELKFASMKIQACSTVDSTLPPLRLITNDARCRITLKKKLNDCSVVGCRLAIVVDALLYVFTDSQLKAAKVFIDSLLHLVQKGQEQAKKVKALRKLESTEIRTDSKSFPQQFAAGQRTTLGHTQHSLFHVHDVVETSYHFACKQLELHLSDDAGPGRSSHPELKNGGAMVVNLGRLYFDYYPYHPVGSWEGPGARKHWVNYPSGTTPAIWEAKDLTAFKADLSAILRGSRPSHAPLQRTQAVEDSVEFASRQSQPQPRLNQESGSSWSTGRPPALPQLKKLMSACLIFRLSEFRVHQVTTREKKHLREFLNGDQEMAPLPDNSYRVHLEFIQYYYPGNMDFPLPPMKLYVHCNPIAVKFDELTICWANAVIGNLVSEWEQREKVNEGSAEDLEPDLARNPPLDVKIEMIMPKVVLEGQECPGQPDRPTCLQFMCTRLLCSNYRQQGCGSRADLAKCLEGIQNGSLFFGSAFPSTKDDPLLVHPKFLQHATGNDHLSAVPVPASEESSRKSSTGEASRDLMWYEAKDVWFCQCDPVWGEFFGAKAMDHRPVPLLDTIPLELWGYMNVKANLSECYAIVDVPNLITVQLNHYQNLFLLRLFDRLTKMSDVLAADASRVEKRGFKRRMCFGGMFPQVDISLLMPSQTADKLPSLSSPGESSIIAETSSMTDLAGIVMGCERRLQHHANDRQGTLDSLDSVAAFYPKLENGPLLKQDQDKESSARKESLKHQRSNSTVGNASPQSLAGLLPESKSQSFLSGAFSNLKMPDNLNSMKKGMSTLLTNMALTSPSLSPLHSASQFSDAPSFHMDRLVIEEDAMSTISSESETFVHLSSSDLGAAFYQSVDQCLLSFPSAKASAADRADEVEIATDVLDDASFANPSTPSDELPSSLTRRKDVISVLTIRVGQVQFVQHIEDSESVMKLECCHLAFEDCPAIAWDEFQNKFSSGKNSWSDTSADAEHRCSVRMRYSMKPVEREPCHAFTQDVLSVSPEANRLLRGRLDRFCKEQMRHVTGDDSMDDSEKWQRRLCLLLCEDMRSHGGPVLEMELKDIRLHLLMSIAMGLTALFEEEEIVPPLPMKVIVCARHERVSVRMSAVVISAGLALWWKEPADFRNLKEIKRAARSLVAKNSRFLKDEPSDIWDKSLSERMPCEYLVSHRRVRQKQVEPDSMVSMRDMSEGDTGLAGISQIASFYRNRSVLITGATGFMGKVLVEKLLRSCPDIGKIYLLMRPKRGQEPYDRVKELLSAKLFEKLQAENPRSFDKLIAVKADVMEPGLGLSQEDETELVQNVSVVFHAAATVKFDEALKVSINMNVQGTKRIIDLCHKMDRLAALVHVSTAYCNCDREEISEIVYPPPHDPEQIIGAMTWMDDEMVQEITARLIGNRPNTYTYTKALAEAVLVREAADLPVAIVRPSIVAAAWKEPIPGWIDNFNGATGLFVGVGKGLVRSILCHREKKADLIPVDIPINLMIAVGWYTALKSPNRMLVYNCTSGQINPIRWGEIEAWGHDATQRNPFNDVMWYPSGSFRKSRIAHFIACTLLHSLPAYLMDVVSRISRQKPVMVRLCTKFSRALKTLEYFSCGEWDFRTENVPMLLGELSSVDRKLFDFDLRPLQWSSYITLYFLGARAYALKENPADMPKAKRRMTR
ncbi:unnamed protein product [Notodromas monacha]|uniref:alcohol-forming fatty acyl-CoA reductase (NADPH) n=1 Tax=Notodromas monacha TaxID=399045 RepID=A0A7R9GA71_9CRUS|nr:unnamed protein product [Notodromas monacha]CAG0913699.1 unnamed protein product [Notodromas monacha]